MATHFKDLYRRYMEKGLPSSDLREFKKELDHIPDEELWNTMINMEKDSAPEIGMPPMMKKQIRKELHQIIWRRYRTTTRTSIRRSFLRCSQKPGLSFQSHGK